MWNLFASSSKTDGYLHSNSNLKILGLVLEKCSIKEHTLWKKVSEDVLFADLVVSCL